MEVERARVNAHADFAGGGSAGIVEVDELEVVEPGGLAQNDGFHQCCSLVLWVKVQITVQLTDATCTIGSGRAVPGRSA